MGKLLPNYRCPSCWVDFRPEEVHWIATSPDLGDDPQLEPTNIDKSKLLRFLPRHFTPDGKAVDKNGKGRPCSGLACPYCHLEFPRSYLESRSFMTSIVGGQGTGKSYFLVSLVWWMKRKGRLQETHVKGYHNGENMLGAIIGDICGSIYEWNNKKTTNPREISLRRRRCHLTDDTVMTIATAESLLRNKEYVNSYKEWGRRYPKAGYGGRFREWLQSDSTEPFKSWGNGSAMRVSPIGWAFTTLEKTLAEAKRSADATHNHPEGVKGAQAVAAAIFLARNGKSQQEIKEYIESVFQYDLSRTTAQIRPDYKFDVSCQGSAPEAIICFLESRDFEHALQLAISIGGDTDTIACITGGIAEAYYQKIPGYLVRFAKERLPDEMKRILALFRAKYGQIGKMRKITRYLSKVFAIKIPLSSIRERSNGSYYDDHSRRILYRFGIERGLEYMDITLDPPDFDDTSGYVPELALVAEVDGKIVAHIMLTKTYVDRTDGRFEGLLLAPVSVQLEYRNRGVGSALIREALDRAEKSGFKAVFLAGDRNYYSRFGFAPARRFGIRCPQELPEDLLDNIMACELVPETLANVRSLR